MPLKGFCGQTLKGNRDARARFPTEKTFTLADFYVSFSKASSIAFNAAMIMEMLVQYQPLRLSLRMP
jgi:hypothetical protein